MVKFASSYRRVEISVEGRGGKRRRVAQSDGRRSNSDQDWRERRRTRGLLEVDEMDAISSSVRVLQM